jgi:hypothetical protein
MVMIDLRLEAAFIRENMQIKWHSETGLNENILKIIKEYKLARNLIVCWIFDNFKKVKKFMYNLLISHSKCVY